MDCGIAHSLHLKLHSHLQLTSTNLSVAIPYGKSNTLNTMYIYEIYDLQRRHGAQRRRQDKEQKQSRNGLTNKGAGVHTR